MKPELENIALHKNEDKKRFELEVNGYMAFIDYKETENHISLIHTESPTELAGTGAASALVEKTLVYIKETGKKLLPFCPFVFAFIKKHPEWKALVDEHFKGYDQL